MSPASCHSTDFRGGGQGSEEVLDKQQEDGCFHLCNLTVGDWLHLPTEKKGVQEAELNTPV